MELFNDNCFNVLPKIKDKTIDLFLLDLPYNNKDFGKCTACVWDNTIDLDKMWVQIKRIMTPNALILFFCNTKFGFSLIKSNPKWFRYDLIWKKSRKVGFLSANKMPLRQHENIYVFSNEEDDKDIVRNNELREYSKKVYEYIGKSLKTINKELGHRKAEHFFYFKTSQFGLPLEKTYNELIEKYNIDKMEGFKTHEQIKDLEELTTYNPQKTKGKEYKSKERIEGEGIYLKDNYKRTATKDTINRYPTSILEHSNPKKSLHKTQKPLSLCEWLIKTYSNENDLVMDFTMGSGTTGEACKNTNRKFIGIEKDKEIFEIAKKRLE